MNSADSLGAQIVYDEIENALLFGRGLLIGRFGTIEFQAIYSIECLNTVSNEERYVLEMNAGVFPSHIESVRKWVEEARNAMRSADVLATGWYAPIREKEAGLLKAWGWSGRQVRLRSLEPYYFKESLRWTRHLSGRKVCVVSSFTETAAGQLAKCNGESAIWPGAGGSLLPDAEWSWVQTGYAPCMALGRAGWENAAESWKEAVDYVVEEVMKKGAKICIIGCGGLGMLIGASLKKRGVVAIVLGGATQVLFGIKGRRWENHEIISKFWNDAWVWPSREETPGAADEVEGGCYWS